MKKEWMEALVEGLFFVEASMKRWRWAALAPELSGLCDRASGLVGVGSVASRLWAVRDVEWEIAEVGVGGRAE